MAGSAGGKVANSSVRSPSLSLLSRTFRSLCAFFWILIWYNIINWCCGYAFRVRGKWSSVSFAMAALACNSFYCCLYNCYLCYTCKTFYKALFTISATMSSHGSLFWYHLHLSTYLKNHFIKRNMNKKKVHQRILRLKKLWSKWKKLHRLC